jgi:hypothetical protein
MQRFARWQRFLALWLTSGFLFGAGCVKVAQESAVDGFVNYFRRGGLTSTFNSNLLNDFIINVLTGGFTGGETGGSQDGSGNLGGSDGDTGSFGS